MLRFHREGYQIMLISSLAALFFIGLCWTQMPTFWILDSLISLTVLVFWVLVMQFFRNPPRPLLLNDSFVYAPADGDIVVIEETFESEILNQNGMQRSIFMSPLNVHVNRHPVSGRLSYYRYHPGKFLVAWNPKASTDNERTTVVYDLPNGKKVLVRQIAGFVARRIICYAEEGAEAKQGQELGFIRFGSRVDVFLPTDADIKVKIGEKSVGNQTILAMFQ